MGRADTPAASASDVELLRRSGTGDEPAYDELVARHRPALLSFATELAGDPVAAETIVTASLGELRERAATDAELIGAVRPFLLATAAFLHGTEFDLAVECPGWDALGVDEQATLWHLDVEGDSPEVVAMIVGESVAEVRQIAWTARGDVSPDDDETDLVERVTAYLLGPAAEAFHASHKPAPSPEPAAEPAAEPEQTVERPVTAEPAAAAPEEPAPEEPVADKPVGTGLVSDAPVVPGPRVVEEPVATTPRGSSPFFVSPPPASAPWDKVMPTPAPSPAPTLVKPPPAAPAKAVVTPPPAPKKALPVVPPPAKALVTPPPPAAAVVAKTPPTKMEPAEPTQPTMISPPPTAPRSAPPSAPPPTTSVTTSEKTSFQVTQAPEVEQAETTEVPIARFADDDTITLPLITLEPEPAPAVQGVGPRALMLRAVLTSILAVAGVVIAVSIAGLALHKDPEPSESRFEGAGPGGGRHHRLISPGHTFDVRTKHRRHKHRHKHTASPSGSPSASASTSETPSDGATDGTSQTAEPTGTSGTSSTSGPSGSPTSSTTSPHVSESTSPSSSPTPTSTPTDTQSPTDTSSPTA